MNPVRMRYGFILNPSSGRKRPVRTAARIEKWCDTFQLDYRVYPWEDRDGLDALVAQARAEGCTCIVAVGGDGTIHHVARRILHDELALGVVPAGTGNAIARCIGVPLSVKGAIKILAAAHVLTMDVGEVNGRPFIGFFGLGLDADVIHVFRNIKQRSFFAYARHTLRFAWNFHRRVFRIALNGREEDVDPMVPAVLNVPQFGSGAVVARDASFLDGKLDFVQVFVNSRFQLPGIVWRLFYGRLENFRGFRQETFETMRIMAPDKSLDDGGKVHAQIDGEACFMPPVMDVRVLPAALKILVNPEASIA